MEIAAKAAGVDLVHVSIYSVRPDVEARLRGTGGTLEGTAEVMPALLASMLRIAGCWDNRGSPPMRSI